MERDIRIRRVGTWCLSKKKTERIEKTVFDVNSLLNFNHSYLHLDIHYY